MKKILIILFIFGLFSLNSYSLSLEELINSYDFNYKSENVEVELLNYYILNDTLYFNFSLYGFQGDYLLNFKIISEETITFKSKSQVLNLNKSFNSFLINQTLNKLETNDYKLIFFLEKDKDIIYRNYSFLEFNLTTNYSLDVGEETLIKNYIKEINYREIDSNSNGLIEVIELDLELNEEIGGDFKINLLFTNYLDEFVFSKVLEKNLANPRQYKINLTSSDFLRSKKDGPYFLKSISLTNINSTSNFESLNFQLGNYTLYDFEYLNLIDLKFENVSYNSSTGNFSFLISNKGGQDSSYFFVNLFDSNLDYNERFIVFYLRKNESIFYNYNLSENLSEIYLSLDFNDLIFESNELNNNYIWSYSLTPVNYKKIIRKENTTDRKFKFKIDSEFEGRTLNLNYDFQDLGVDVLFSNFNVSLNLNKSIDFEFYDNGGEFLKVLAVETDFNFSSSNITFKYNSSLVLNESNLKVYYCSNYDFESQECLEDFSDITERVFFDNLSDSVSFVVDSFSAYALREGELEKKVSESGNFQGSSGSSSSSKFSSQINYLEDKNESFKEVEIDTSSMNTKTIIDENSNLSNKSNLSNNSFLDNFEVVLRPDENYNNKLTGNFLEKKNFSLIGFSIGVVIIIFLLFIFR